MKPQIKIMLLSSAMAFVLTDVAFTQEEITEAEYLKQDSILWTVYEQQQESLSQLWEIMPEKQDSIQHVFDSIYNETSRRNRELAIQYASVPSGLQRLYMVRLDLPKDTLIAVINSLSPDMQQSFYGGNIQAHIETKQVEKGDPVDTFPCIQDDGNEFDWTTTRDKQLLILFGGLGCMGTKGRQYLEQLYEKTSRDEFLIVVYWPVSSLQNLRNVREQFPSDYIFISDFKQDASPIKIKYGTQATPTCFLTDREHVVKVKCTGVKPELFNEHINFSN